MAKGTKGIKARMAALLARVGRQQPPPPATPGINGAHCANTERCTPGFACDGCGYDTTTRDFMSLAGWR